VPHTGSIVKGCAGDIVALVEIASWAMGRTVVEVSILGIGGLPMETPEILVGSCQSHRYDQS
jgi:peptide subunit release factor RF-3